MSLKYRPSSEWPGRLGLVIFGVALLLFGYFEWRHGYFWHVSFNERFGRPSFVPALWLMALGSLFTLTGLMPWNRISEWLERRDASRRK